MYCNTNSIYCTSNFAALRAAHHRYGDVDVPTFIHCRVPRDVMYQAREQGLSRDPYPLAPNPEICGQITCYSASFQADLEAIIPATNSRKSPDGRILYPIFWPELDPYAKPRALVTHAFDSDTGALLGQLERFNAATASLQANIAHWWLSGYQLTDDDWWCIHSLFYRHKEIQRKYA